MFDFAITTAANVTKASPTVTELPLDKGVIDRVQIAFPPGPQGLLHVVIYRGSSILWPRNEGEGFAWDDFTLEFNPFYKLLEEPLGLEARTWNDDDAYEHQVTIRFNVVLEEIIFPRPESPGGIAKILRALGIS